ncbi:FAD-binding protein [Bauldia litoralis]|uniref:FAD-binding protein n=1 Tax=Bauldia litoralis TaxID=665467 RepID=UPI003299E066
MATNVADASNRTGTNWAGNLTYHANAVQVPATREEAQACVRASERLRVLGSCHCFNDIADTTGTHLSLERFRRVVSLDRAVGQVTVEAGIRYSDLAPYLHEHGFALQNLASLPHITIAGACATATHGSGVGLGNLATQVAAMEFIDASGTFVTLSRTNDPDTFPGAVVNLGALGVVTRLTLDIQPDFNVSQHVFLDLPMNALDAHFDEIMSSGYSVSLFTDWRGDTIDQVWIKSVTGAGPDLLGRKAFHGARPATRNAHPAGGDPANCTRQLGVPGSSYDRLPHLPIGAIPAPGGDSQAEYFVAREDAVAAGAALRAFGDRMAPHLMQSEVRVVAADDLWMSPCYGEPRVAFHFSFKPDWPAVKDLLPALEAVLEPFDPIPHWGKLFAMQPGTVKVRYKKLDAFRDLLEKHDPTGKFRNSFVNRNIFEAD